jgi:murein DD-endopeptidase MepM/ murein hydrolase activator NlpD
MYKIRFFPGVLLFLASLIVMPGCIRGLNPIRVIAELKTGETQSVRLTNGKEIKLTLLEIREERDSLRNAIRKAYVKVIVDGKEAILNPGNYNLPRQVGRVQIDCPWIKGYESGSGSGSGHTGDAVFRIWPEQTPYLNPLTFTYPVKGQKWFAGMTQSGHEPTYVDWGEDPSSKNIYYHWGHDIGGAEALDEIISATDGIIISANNEVHENYKTLPVYVHPDAVSILDNRGWIIEYDHLFSTDAEIRPGERIKMGQKIGLMGKKGSSGGWVHLHFEIKTKDNPSNSWTTEDAYAYLWESYMRQHSPHIVAAQALVYYSAKRKDDQ